MSRYVDLSNPKIFHNGRDKFGNGVYHIPPDLPVADIAEVQHGRWIYDDEAYPGGNPYGHYDCDQCGESVPHKTNYCPNCGAKMVNEVEE